MEIILVYWLFCSKELIKNNNPYNLCFICFSMEKYQLVEIIVLVVIFFVVVLLFAYSFGITGFVVFGGSEFAPHDFVGDNQINLKNNSFEVFLSNYTLVRFEDTGSMLPLLGENSTGVGIRPISEEDIHVGDVVFFKQDDLIVVHRVIEIGADDGGNYFVTKGDRNSAKDEKIRFEDVEGVLVGIIY